MLKLKSVTTSPKSDWSVHVINFDSEEPDEEFGFVVEDQIIITDEATDCGLECKGDNTETIWDLKWVVSYQIRYF